MDNNKQLIEQLGITLGVLDALIKDLQALNGCAGILQPYIIEEIGVARNMRLKLEIAFSIAKQLARG